MRISHQLKIKDSSVKSSSNAENIQLVAWDIASLQVVVNFKLACIRQDNLKGHSLDLRETIKQPAFVLIGIDDETDFNWWFILYW